MPVEVLRTFLNGRRLTGFFTVFKDDFRTCGGIQADIFVGIKKVAAAHKFELLTVQEVAFKANALVCREFYKHGLFTGMIS